MMLIAVELKVRAAWLFSDASIAPEQKPCTTLTAMVTQNAGASPVPISAIAVPNVLSASSRPRPSRADSRSERVAEIR